MEFVTHFENRKDTRRVRRRRQEIRNFFPAERPFLQKDHCTGPVTLVNLHPVRTSGTFISRERPLDSRSPSRTRGDPLPARLPQDPTSRPRVGWVQWTVTVKLLPRRGQLKGHERSEVGVALIGSTPVLHHGPKCKEVLTGTTTPLLFNPATTLPPHLRHTGLLLEDCRSNHRIIILITHFYRNVSRTGTRSGTVYQR